MNDTVLAGRGRAVVRVSARDWLEHLVRTPEEVRGLLSFMSKDHRRVRRFVVLELARSGAPVAVESICRSLGLQAARALQLLEDLERQLFFLVRDAQGAVTWAFPVTVDRTPHHLAFSSGERLWAA